MAQPQHHAFQCSELHNHRSLGNHKQSNRNQECCSHNHSQFVHKGLKHQLLAQQQQRQQGKGGQPVKKNKNIAYFSRLL